MVGWKKFRTVVTAAYVQLTPAHCFTGSTGGTNGGVGSDGGVGTAGESGVGPAVGVPSGIGVATGGDAGVGSVRTGNGVSGIGIGDN